MNRTVESQLLSVRICEDAEEVRKATADAQKKMEKMNTGVG